MVILIYLHSSLLKKTISRLIIGLTVKMVILDNNLKRDDTKSILLSNVKSHIIVIVFISEVQNPIHIISFILVHLKMF